MDEGVFQASIRASEIVNELNAVPEPYMCNHRYTLCRIFLQHTIEQVPDRPFDLSRHLKDSRFDFQQEHADVVVIEGQTTSDQSEKDDAA